MINAYNDNAWDNNDEEDKTDDVQVFDEDEEYFYIYHGCDDIQNQEMLNFIQLTFNTIKDEYNKISSASNQSNLIFVVLSTTFDKFKQFYPFLCESLVDINDRNNNNEHEIYSYPNSILDNYLYLGGGGHASNYETFKNLKITHCLNVTKHVKCHFKSEGIKYLQIEIDDRYTEKIDEHFETAHRFINNALYDIDAAVITKNPFDDDVQNSTKLQPIKDRVVFVHCQGGVSRSSSIIISI